MDNAGYEAELVPDVILCSPTLMAIKPRRGRDSIIVDHFSGIVTLQDYNLVLPSIQSAKTVLTGSFHAALVAIMFGKKVAVWSSSTHKMEGLAIDAGITGKPIKQNVMPADCAKATNREYVEQGQATINHMFEHLTTLA
jgi:exopolysaccharide biosynthesis predicted pyruvyltransferase EpsI